MLRLYAAADLPEAHLVMQLLARAIDAAAPLPRLRRRLQGWRR